MRRFFIRTGGLAVMAMLAAMVATPAQAAPGARSCATPSTVPADSGPTGPGEVSDRGDSGRVSGRVSGQASGQASGRVSGRVDSGQADRAQADRAQAGPGRARPARAGSPPQTVGDEPVDFQMETAGSPVRFVIRLTDAKKIEHARRILSGKETSKVHVMGRIVKRTVPYNPAYGFHLDPNTIDFFQMAIEVCDATLSYVEDHLDEACGAFLPGCVYCPWTSRLVAEVTPS